MIGAVFITIPGDAVGKGRPRFVRATGRTFTPKKTVNAEAFIKSRAADAMAGRPLLLGPVRMIARVTVAVPESWSGKRKTRALAGEERPAKRPDLDNLVKAWSDALNGIVYRDDAQIVELVVSKRYGDHPETELVISEIDPAGSLPLLDPSRMSVERAA